MRSLEVRRDRPALVRHRLVARSQARAELAHRRPELVAGISARELAYRPLILRGQFCDSERR